MKDEKDAGKAALERKAAKQRIRRGSKFHRSYPNAGAMKPIAFWPGLEATLDHHRALLRNTGEGKLVILFGESGGGKTSAIKAIIHGKTGIKPERSLMVRFVSFNGIAEEQAVLNRMAKELRFHVEENVDVDYAELAQFVVDAVIKDEKEGIAAFQDVVMPSLKKLGSSFLSMCGAKETWEDEEEPPRPMEIIGIPLGQTKTMRNGHTKPIILFDDVNRTIQKDGPLGNFFYTVASLAQDNNVICYIITQTRQTAYRIWQKNGGNWIAPHQAVVGRVIPPSPKSLSEWADKYEDFKKEEVATLDEKIPSFYFLKPAFVFGDEAKKTLLWNIFSVPLKEAHQREYLKETIDGIVAKDPDMKIDSLMVELEELGYYRPDSWDPPRVST